MASEEEEIQRLLTEINLKKNSIRAQLNKNERKSVVEIVCVVFQLLAVGAPFLYKPCLRKLACRTPQAYHWYYSNETFFGYWYYDWFYDNDMSRFGQIQWYYNSNSSTSWHGTMQFCRDQNAQLCSFDHYCPNGLHGELSEDIPSDLTNTWADNDVWLPHGDLFNGYVQVGQWSGRDSDHDGQKCFTNPWGHTWGLNDNNSKHVCCVHNAPDITYEFCEGGWYDTRVDTGVNGQTCYGWTTNYHYYHLVVSGDNLAQNSTTNDRTHLDEYKIKFDNWPVIIGFSDTLNHNEMDFELEVLGWHSNSGVDTQEVFEFRQGNGDSQNFTVIEKFVDDDMNLRGSVTLRLKVSPNQLEVSFDHLTQSSFNFNNSMVAGIGSLPYLWVSSGTRLSHAGTNWEITRY